MKKLTWYFDYISPYACLAFHRLRELPDDVEVTFKPTLFAGLLKATGNKGPAEIEGKRLHTYRQTQWQARKMGVPFRYPEGHPFNPLKALRLTIALGASREVVEKIFAAVWQKGWLPDDPQGWEALCDSLNVGDGDSLVSNPEIKQALIQNVEEALEAKVFGVPTAVIDGELFWGVDSMDLLLDYLNNPGLFEDPEMARLSTLGKSAERKEVKS